MVKDNSSRQVTFSKRRTGLFKKGNELATLCGAEVAVVVFSPGGKPFSFGHPSVESVVDRFRNQDQKPNNGRCVVGSSNDAKVDKLNRKLTDLLKQFEAEKKRGEMIEKAMKAKGVGKAPINELSLHEVEELKGSLEELRENIKARVSEMEASSSLLLLAKETSPRGRRASY